MPEALNALKAARASHIREAATLSASTTARDTPSVAGLLQVCCSSVAATSKPLVPLIVALSYISPPAHARHISLRP